MPSCGVCVSVTFVDSIKTSKLNFRLFHRRVATHHCSFSVHVLAILRLGLPNGGAKCRWCTHKLRWVLDVRLNDRAVYRTDGDALVNLCLSQPAAWKNTPKITEHNFIVRSSKSEAEVTNNKRLHSRYCTVEANYRHTHLHYVHLTCWLCLLNCIVFYFYFILF